jgi:uncharacterized membrane protein YdjX (TVP38/TMEM64 family)
MNKNKKIFKIIITLVIVFLIGFIMYNFKKLDGFSAENIRDFINGYGVRAPIVYIIMFSVVPLTLFPDSILAISGGLIFGLVKGYLYTTIGALIGGTISFYISKFLGRSFIQNISKGKIQKMEEAIEERGFALVVLLRLIPLFPFDIISYGAGLTKIRYIDFILATFIGTIPGILVFTNIGAQWVNFGSSKFYFSITFLILLILISLFLKKKVFTKKDKIL